MAKRKNRKLKTTLAAVAIVAALAGGGWYYRSSTLASASASEPQLQTSVARKGDMTITLSGAGTLVSSSSVDVGFDTSGKVSQVLVQVGDSVDAGDVLASIDGTDAQAAVDNAEISLRLAEISLAELQEPADASDLASAQAALTMAQENLADLQAGSSADELAAAQAAVAAAEDNYADLAAGPTTAEATSAEATLEKARIALQQAEIAYADVANDTEKSAAAAADYQQALLEYQVAQANYDAAMAGASDSDLQTAGAQLAQARTALADLQAGASAGEIADAQAQVATAQANLDDLQAGASENDRETAALNVRKAQLALDEAEAALAAVDLQAPISGVVTAVETAAGQTAGTGTAFTIADMSAVQVEFYVDETDMSLLATGEQVSVVLDALPDETFSGEILRIEPGLTEVSGVPVVTVWASIDVSGETATTLIEDMSATVEVLAADHQGVVLVPVQAVEENDDGTYTVSVVGADGSLSERIVTVGLTDDVNYEVTGGLQPGEAVSLGTTGSSSTTTTSDQAASSQSQTGAPPDMAGGGMPPMN